MKVNTRKSCKYLVTAIHEDAIRIQTFEYPSIKAAQADAKKHGWKIQSVQKIGK